MDSEIECIIDGCFYVKQEILELVICIDKSKVSNYAQRAFFQNVARSVSANNETDIFFRAEDDTEIQCTYIVTKVAYGESMTNSLQNLVDILTFSHIKFFKRIYLGYVEIRTH